MIRQSIVVVLYSLESKGKILEGLQFSLSKRSSFLNIDETLPCFKQSVNSPLARDLLTHCVKISKVNSHPLLRYLLEYLHQQEIIDFLTRLKNGSN